MQNVRIRSAILALLLGNLGVDMLLLRPHQIKLFLGLGGTLLLLVVLGLIGGVAYNGAWIFLSVIAGGFLSFWSIARCFEYLSLTDESFERRLEGLE